MAGSIYPDLLGPRHSPTRYTHTRGNIKPFLADVGSSTRAIMERRENCSQSGRFCTYSVTLFGYIARYFYDSSITPVPQQS